MTQAPLSEPLGSPLAGDELDVLACLALGTDPVAEGGDELDPGWRRLAWVRPEDGPQDVDEPRQRPVASQRGWQS